MYVDFNDTVNNSVYLLIEKLCDWNLNAANKVIQTSKDGRFNYSLKEPSANYVQRDAGRGKGGYYDSIWQTIWKPLCKHTPAFKLISNQLIFVLLTTKAYDFETQFPLER